MQKPLEFDPHAPRKLEFDLHCGSLIGYLMCAMCERTCLGDLTQPLINHKTSCGYKDNSLVAFYFGPGHLRQAIELAETTGNDDEESNGLSVSAVREKFPELLTEYMEPTADFMESEVTVARQF